MIHTIHRKVMQHMNSSIPILKGKKLRNRVVMEEDVVSKNRKTPLLRLTPLGN